LAFTVSYQKYLAWTLGTGGRRQKMILQLVESGGQERCESTEVRENNFECLEIGWNIRLQ